jgi:hypothetical protein
MMAAYLAHPAFAPLGRWLAVSTSPPLAMLNAWAREAGIALSVGRPLCFVAPSGTRQSAIDYERRVVERGEVTTRPNNSHDVWNALAWLAFPRLKTAINAIHVAAATAPTGNARNQARDAATLLDEYGLIVACAEADLLALWRAHAWRELFWTRRADVLRAMRVAAIGHGLLQKLLTPFPGITGRALVVSVDTAGLPDDSPALAARLDAAAAARLRDYGPRFVSASLPPLPVAALPGWDPGGDDLGERRFDDESVFRPRRVVDSRATFSNRLRGRGGYGCERR